MLNTGSLLHTKEVSQLSLVDLQGIKVSGKTSSERLASYLAQVGDPYCFRVGETPVRISFEMGEKSLEEKLKSYFLSRKI